MKIEIGSKLIVKDPTQEVQDYCYHKLVVPNPDYYKKQKMGKWTGNLPMNIHLFEKCGDDLWLPFGCIRDLWSLYPVKEAYRMAIKPIQERLYKSNINLYPYQEEAVNKALRAKNGLIVMPCGGGKGLPLDAKIYTPEGWKRNGDLKIGDEVIGSDGETYHVTGIYDKGAVPAYKITFSDGVKIVCDKDHLWNVQKQTQRNDGGKWWTECTEDIYTHYQNIKRQDLYYIPVVHPVKFKHRKTTMDPWLLGFLLGDGCLSTKMVSFSTNENEILQKVKNITCDSVHYKGKYDYYFAGGEIKKKIEKLSLYGHRSWEKFIPNEYKYNSVRVRLKVLQGLFDADGYVSGKGVYEYSTASIQLANDFVEIVESLGGTAKISEKIPTYTYNGEKKVGRKSYRIHFKLYDFKPYTSTKHTDRDNERSQYTKAYRIIKKIEPCGEIISRCITVDAPDSLYVTDHFVVTHNTQTGLELIARIGGRALWLTHTQDLLNQSKDRAKGTLDLCGGKYGTITAGKVNIGTHITFATVQTMCKLDLTQYRDCFDVVIVDECQHCCGSPTKVTQFYKVVSNLSARYKIGLTATPKRSDGLEIGMYSLLGGIIHEVPKEAVKATTCPVKVRKIETGYMPDYNAVLMGDGTIDYSKIVEDLTHNEERFRKVLDTVNSLDGSAIVLANRVEYLSRLSESFSGRSVCLSTLGQSKKAKQMRKDALAKLKNGELDCIFATYALAREGLDVPNLRYVVFATPEKDETTVIQSAGRVGRKAEGKEYGTVIDFVDSFGMYRRWSKKRDRYYKKIDAEIE